MINASPLNASLNELVNTALEAETYGLWGIVFSKNKHRALLRVFIDSDKGVDIDECGKASRLIEAELDIADIIQDEYTLEVSSPGINRMIFTPEQFNKYKNQSVIVTLYQAIDNKKNIKGSVLDCENNILRISYIEKEIEQEIAVPISSISRARLDVTW